MNETLLQILRYLFTIGIPSLLIVVAILALLKVYVLPAFFTSHKKQESKQNAVVLKKKEEVLSGGGIYSLYLVTFKLEDDSIELRVPKNVFLKLDGGDKGQLTNVGDRFIEFNITEKSQSTNEPQVILAGDTMRSSLNIIEQKQRE